MSVTDLPTLASTWSAPTSCFATTNYYYVLLGSGYFSNMYGTPTPVLTGITPSGTCFPPSFTIDVPYVTDGGCPSGYTLACASAATGSVTPSASMMTCCPSVTSDVFSFMCKDDQYGCHATATAGVVWTGIETDIGLPVPTEAPITRTPSTAEGCEAWGIKFLSVPKAASRTTEPTQSVTSLSPVSTSAPQTSPRSTASQLSSTKSPSDGLSGGSEAGIAVGSVAGVALLAAAGFVFYRKKRKHNNNTFPPNASREGPQLKEEYKSISQSTAYQLDGGDLPTPLSLSELQG